MSRFVEVLRQHLKQPIDLDDVEDILKDLLTRLESETAALKMKFLLFIEKKAPVSGESSLMDYEVICDATRSGGQTEKAFDDDTRDHLVSLLQGHQPTWGAQSKR